MTPAARDKKVQIRERMFEAQDQRLANRSIMNGPSENPAQPAATIPRQGWGSYHGEGLFYKCQLPFLSTMKISYRQSIASSIN